MSHPDPAPPAGPPGGLSARAQILVAAAAGVVTGLAGGLLTFPALGVLIGWDAAAGVYLLRTWRRLRHMDPEQTAQSAVYVDPTRATADLVLLGAAVASLAAVGGVLVRAASSKSTAEDLLVALAMVSVVLSWGVVHTVFALRYAALFYTGPDGGIGFNEREPPDYVDFLYVALTIGMTFQVSDTDLQTKAIRRTAVRHALLSYVFGAGIVATTVNLVASLTTK
jgi:uncharacterized membrane protein